MAFTRRYTFKLYPRDAQSSALEHQRRLHCDLYNAALQQRIEAYQRRGKTLTAYGQGYEIKALRVECPEYAELSSCSLHATLQRLERAFQAFFRRAKSGAGSQSGFPKFRSRDRFPGFSFKRPGSGWKISLDRGANGRPRNGRLYLKGVPGLIRLRGRLPCEPEAVKTCELCWREERWWLSLVVEMPPRRQSGVGAGRVRFDLIDSFCGVTRMNGGRTAGPEREYQFSRDGRIRESTQ